MRQCHFCIMLAVLLIGAPSHGENEANFRHDLLDSVLTGRVDGTGGVDYTGLASQRQTLDRYVAALALCSPHTCADRFPGADDRLAYWINAYNAFVLLGVIDALPIGSVADVDGGLDGFFRTKRFVAGGDTLSLDDIENGIIRPEFRDPRIHFAVNCGARSCPALDRRAYQGNNISAHLDAQARRFAADSAHVRWEAGRLHVSRIMDWYGEDFVTWFPTAAEIASQAMPEQTPTLVDYLRLYAPPELSHHLVQGVEIPIQFNDYDWALNAVQTKNGL